MSTSSVKRRKNKVAKIINKWITSKKSKQHVYTTKIDGVWTYMVKKNED